MKENEIQKSLPHMLHSSSEILKKYNTRRLFITEKSNSRHGDAIELRVKKLKPHGKEK